MTKALKYAENYLAQLAAGNLTVDADPRLLKKNNALGRLSRQMQKISDNMKEKSSALESIARGELPSSEFRTDDSLSHAVSQITANIKKLEAESGAVHTAVLAGELDSRLQSNQLPGFYGAVAEYFNENMDTVVFPLRQIHDALGKVAINNFTSRITGEYRGQIKEMTGNMNIVCERLTALSESIEKISRGDTGDLAKYRQIVRRSEADRIIPAMLIVTENIEHLVSTVNGMAQNVVDGDILSAKADSGAFEGGYRSIIDGVNNLIDAFSAPLSDTISLLSSIAVNDYTHDLNINAKGDFTKLAEQVNTVLKRLRYLQEVAVKVSQGDIGELDTLRKIGRRSDNDKLVPSFTQMMESIQDLIHETGNIAGATSKGDFDYVCKTDRFQGEYKNIILTFESSFQVMAEFVKETSTVMQAMSNGQLHVSVKNSYGGQLKTLADSVNLTAQRLSAVIGEIAKAMTSISGGDLSLNNVREFRGDFSAISAAINTILSSLNSLLGQIDIAAGQVSAGSSQVSAASQALSQGATEQASSVEELTSSITEVASQVRENAESAKKAKEVSNDANVNARQGNDQMKLMLKSMNEINEGSANISKIIKVIDDIAFQTNILALNAAVEAARAGQAGKGFAVVAEEVRNLAARSANAAKETTSLIEGNIGKVETGMKIANETASELDKIVDGIEQSAAFINDIAEASNQQATAIAQIDSGIEQVSTVVQTNSATAEESAASSEELSSQAFSLKQLVSQFKLRNVEA